ncbi:unnamed protein product [Rotaria sp. Silwood1]|nr:unnamed protein product [Rotaria sp. Silwood1]
MDSKKSGATASSETGKHGEKKDNNFFSKTARSIRERVQEITDDVKEKTQTLTRSNESKKKRKHKNQKTKDTETNRLSKSATTGRKDSDLDSSDEDSSTKPQSPHFTPAKTANTSDISRSKPLSSVESEKNDAVPSARSKTPTDHLASNRTENKSSTDHKDAAVAAAATTTASSSSLKPSDNSSATKPSSSSLNNGSKSTTENSNNNTDDEEVTNTSSSTKNNTDRVHLSFDGINTVNDLLDRIDETVEKAKLVIEGGSGKIGLNINRVPYVPKHSSSDVEKKPKEKIEDKKQEEIPKKKEVRKEEPVKDEDEDEKQPLRIDYNEIHTIEDLLVKLNNHPGSRKVVLENEPDNADSITIQNPTDRSSTTLLTSIKSDDNDDTSTTIKSVLKTSQDPSSLDTATKISSFQDDQIHVNMGSVQNIGELLDRIDDAVQHAPVIIETKHQEKKRQAPVAPHRNNNNDELETKTSVFTKEQKASQPDNKQTNDIGISTSKISKHHDQQQTSSSSGRNKKKDDNEEVDWI